MLEDEDPAICFVKAYARKPLGVPKKTVANSMDLDDYWYGDYYHGYPTMNTLDYWRDEGDDYDDYDDEDDYGDEYDNYGLYDDYSDSEGDYYDDEDGIYSEEDESEDEETSSEEDNYGGHFDLAFDDEDMWDDSRSYRHHAQYFDLAAANQQAPSSKPAAASGTDTE